MSSRSTGKCSATIFQRRQSAEENLSAQRVRKHRKVLPISLSRLSSAHLSEGTFRRYMTVIFLHAGGCLRTNERRDNLLMRQDDLYYYILPTVFFPPPPLGDYRANEMVYPLLRSFSTFRAFQRKNVKNVGNRISRKTI